jgi:transcriptional regulator with XRE-family HTH domain
MRYLDAAKARAGCTSDYALAKQLDMPQSTISGYRTGRRHLDARAAFQVAELAGIDVREIIAAIELERAKSERDRDFWRTIAGATASIMLAPILLLQPTPATASGLSGHLTEIYILRLLRRIGALVD